MSFEGRSQLQETNGVEVSQELLRLAQRIQERIRDGENPSTIEGYLGTGMHASAYLIDGQVVKIYTQENFSDEIAQEAKRLEKLKGISHAIQFVAAKPNKGVVITELLPGTNVMHDPTHANTRASSDQIKELIQTVTSINERGLIIDPKPGNFNYDSQDGFFVMDPINQYEEYPQAVASQVMGLLHMLTYEGLYNPNKTEEDSLQEERRRYQTSIHLLETAKENFPTLYQEILDEDKRLFNHHGKGFLYPPLFPEDPELVDAKSALEKLGLSFATS